MAQMQIVIPNLGSFADVSVIDVLVAVGDRIEIDTPLITLETDKATMDVPSPASGRVLKLLVAKGDKVSHGSVIADLQLDESGAPTVPIQVAAPAPAPAAVATAAAAVAPAAPAVAADRHVKLLVLGGGPGGYTAAFRAADLGQPVLLVERWPMLGGVCLNVGCIPSKSLLHVAKVLDDARDLVAQGVSFGTPQMDFEKLRGWKNAIVKKLTSGLTTLARQRKVEVLQGVGRFVSPHVIEVSRDSQRQRISFDHCIIAVGSEAVKLPLSPHDARLMDSTGALDLTEVPRRLLVIGGGIIGLEMACVYSALGSRVSVVELSNQLIPGCDADLVRPLEKRIKARYEQVLVGVKVAAIAARSAGLDVSFEGKGAPAAQRYDRVLVAVGRTPNGKLISADAAGIAVDERGFIAVDKQQRTNVAHIYAIGDVVGQPMLAHKATHEAKVAAEVVAGHKSAFDARAIPSVAYTDPEIAWVGLTETQARAQGTPFEKGQFPWAASGRALSQGREEGFTKLLFEPTTRRVLGGGIVGPNAGELIAEVGLAIEMGADAMDIGLTVHAHPTLSETVAMSAEAFAGTLTDLYLPGKR